MKKDIFINELINFCFRYILFDKLIEMDTIKCNLEKQLEDIDFVETLIREIMVKTKSHRGIDIEKAKMLLLELERIRINLEYKEYSPV